MNGKKWFILLPSLVIILLASSIGVTRGSFINPESSIGNALQAWTSTQWVQTTEDDFNAGVLNNVDTSSSPGDVKLGSVSQAQEPTTSVGSEESWYFTSWSRRAPVTINNPGSSLTDYQVKVDVTYDADMQTDFDDIRFVDSDDSTPLSHWRESYTASTSATFWVKVPSIPSGNKTIYMYYGNAAASSASDGIATFVFFDDFLGTTLDTTKWGSWDATVSVFGSVVTITNTGAWGGIISITEYSLPYIFVARAQKTTTLGIGQVGLEKWYVTTGDDTLNTFDVSVGLPQVYYTSKWDGTEEWDVVGTWTLSTWYHYEIKGKSDEVKYYRDGALQNTEITLTAIPVGTMGVLLSSQAINDQLLVDYCFICKYVSPEPTTAVGSEDGWSRRVPVTINNPGSSLTDYQVRVDVTYDTDMQPDFDDIRFVDSDDSTPLSHWRESYTASTSAIFWVKVPSIPVGGKTIYMYYGNATASSASDGNATFVFFDDFEVDLSKWTEINPGHGTATRVTTPTASHGSYCVEIDDTSDTEAFGIKATFASQSICVIEFYMRAAQADKNCRVRIKDSAGAVGPFLRFSKFSTIQHKVAGTWTDTTLTYSADTWYEFKLTEVDSANDTYDIWIDGDLKQDDAGFNAVIADISRVDFIGPQVPIATFYVDLVRVRKYPPPSTYVSSGTIASQVLDTEVSGASWDALFWDETAETGVTDITFEVRASDTQFLKDAATPSWTSVGGTSPLTSGLPSGRYMQWRATLTTSDTSKTPTLHEVRVYHY